MFEMGSVIHNSNLGAISPSTITSSTNTNHLIKMSPMDHDDDSSRSSPNTPNSLMSVSSTKSAKGSSDIYGAKCKRKINFSNLDLPKPHQAATVARRNARERNRVKQVNNGFAALKHSIPLGHRSKKMSKVETLRCAVDYIKNLKLLLDASGGIENSNSGSHSGTSNCLPSSGLPVDEHSPSESSSFSVTDFENTLGNSLVHENFLPVHTNIDGNNVHYHSSSGSQGTQLSPTSSEDPSSPSYASENSYVNSNALFFDYENYEPVSPEDEELLDAISWWQQS